MKYIGNYKELIKDKWIDFLMSNDGQLLPDSRECLLPDFDEQNKKIVGAWQQKYAPSWFKFETQDLPFTIPWPVPLSNNIDWWIIKQYPNLCKELQAIAGAILNQATEECKVKLSDILVREKDPFTLNDFLQQWINKLR